MNIVSHAVEDAHRAGRLHDGSACSLCIASREAVIAQLEAEGKFETLWKYYR